jgi:ATP-dependent RNA helicase RhlE
MTATTVTTATPTHFSEFNLDARLLRAIEESGYTTPTPIQAQAIPVVLTGQDVMGSAQTGTGKTAGFTLPILQKLLPLASTSTSPARHPVRALVLCPTRELAVQVAENADKYSKHTPIRTAVVFGGMDIKSQSPALRAGVEFLVATPGRLLDHLEQGNVSLAQVNYLVLDEADRMLDMGFLPDLQRILNLLPKSRQTLLFSATFSPEIRKLAQSYQKNPVTIETAQRNATSNNVTQTAHKVTEETKRAALVHIIKTEGIEQAMVFVNKKLEARSLARFLEQSGLNVRAIHGDQTQTERLATLDDFKKGLVPLLVATDVAARGLDISDMPCVVNYDLPFSAEDYVHRIGRTGRAGATGRAIALVTERDSKLLDAIVKLTQKPLEAVTLTLPTIERRPPNREHKPEGAPRDRAERPRSNERPAPHRANPINDFELERLRSKTRLSNDPFFSKPYEPAIAPATTADTPTIAPLNRIESNTSRKPTAALFAKKK